MFDDGSGDGGDDAPLPTVPNAPAAPNAPTQVGPPVHPVLSAPVAAMTCLREVLDSSGLSLSLGEVGAGLVAVDALAAATHAVRLHLIRMAQAREPAPGRTRSAPGSVTAYWIKDLLGVSAGQGWADLRAAQATDPDTGTLKGMGAALAAGQIHPAQVDTAVRTLARIPAWLVRERGQDIDALLTEQAKTFTVVDSAFLARSLLSTLAPEGVEEGEKDAYQRRRACVSTDSTGMVVVKAVLDPIGGALFKTFLDHLDRLARANPDAFTPHPTTRAGDGEASVADPEDGGADAAADATPDGESGDNADPDADPDADAADPEDSEAGDPVLEVRTGPQRLADVLVEMARLAAVGLGVKNPEAEPAHLVITLTEDTATEDTATPTAEDPATDDGDAAGDAEPAPSPEPDPATDAPSPGPVPGWVRRAAPASCEATGVLSQRALATLACDAVLQKVLIDRHGKVVSLQHLGRLATRAQRRALAARDGGCAFPGCSAGPSWSQAHHILWWSRGGPTVMDNLCLLCAHHHAVIHREEWTILVINGLPWFQPPKWLDPDQRLRRNNRHRAAHRATTAGHRLRTGQPLHDLLTPEQPHPQQRADPDLPSPRSASDPPVAPPSPPPP